MERPSITIARSLRQMAVRLAYFQDNGEYSYIDKYEEVTSWISATCKKLITYKGETAEEEAEILLAVLVGYSTTIRDEQNIHQAVQRTYKVLPRLSHSLLKCQLLTYCYGEEYDKDLSLEAERIISSWSGRELNEEERRIQQLLKDFQKNEQLFG